MLVWVIGQISMEEQMVDLRMALLLRNSGAPPTLNLPPRLLCTWTNTPTASTMVCSLFKSLSSLQLHLPSGATCPLHTTTAQLVLLLLTVIRRSTGGRMGPL